MPKPARRLRGLVGLAILLSLLLVGASTGLVLGGRDLTAALVGMVAKRLAADLPRRLDPALVWETVEADGRRAVFVYRLDLTSHDGSTRAFLTDVEALVPAFVCDRFALRAMVWAGGALSLRFYDARNNMLRQIDFDPAACAG